MNLPNALIAGTQKSGTTWLAKRLDQHPDIFMASREIHYFDVNRNYERGTRWYSSYFNGAGAQKIKCEKCGAYLWTDKSQDIPIRVKSLLPDVKLIFIFRAPASRAISAWNHLVHFGHLNPSYSINNLFSEEYREIVAHHGILTRGLYHKQIQEYLKHFDPDQMFFMFFEKDIIESPANGLKRVCNFLGIDNNYQFEHLHDPENKIQMTVMGTWGGYYTTGLTHALITKIDRELLYKIPLLPKLKTQKPNAEVLQVLHDYYEDDIQKLKEFLGEVPLQWLP